MHIQDLPEELLLQSLALLDYGSLANLSSTNHFFHSLALDHHIWKAVYHRTFSPSRRKPRPAEVKQFMADRIKSLHEFIICGTNDYHAASALTIFTEMGPENKVLLTRLLAQSKLSVSSLLVQCQGYVMSNISRLIPCLRSSSQAVSQFCEKHRDRLQSDPRSQVYLLRMLLARFNDCAMSVDALDAFLKGSHLITYQSLEHPLWFLRPGSSLVERQHFRRGLRCHTGRQLSASVFDEVKPGGPIVDWGVVETIHSLIKLYRDRMGEAIPGFIKSTHDYETEVPMCSSMFDADLSGNWFGLYGYLDFRELDRLNATREFSPDFFDGIQYLRIGEEHAYNYTNHPLEHGGHMEARATARVANGSSNDNDDNEDSADDADTIIDAEHGSDSTGDARKLRFIADGSSVHGEFHIHGSTIHIPGMERGFKVVKFDEMYNGEGLMPWVMSGVYIPSIGIVGRWRDRTEPVGEGVEGPYCLWRNRVQDLRDQEKAVEVYEAAIQQGLLPPPRPVVCTVRHLKRRRRPDVAYIIIEESFRPDGSKSDGL